MWYQTLWFWYFLCRVFRNCRCPRRRRSGWWQSLPQGSCKYHPHRYVSEIWSKAPFGAERLSYCWFSLLYSVCITSIVRTYYSFQVPKSTDKIYNLELMGLWGWAELATGIIVSCLPVMPRFIQHVGPKIYRTLSLRNNHKFDNAHIMQPTQGIPKTKAFTKIQRPSAKCGASGISEPLDNPYHPPPRLHGEYLPPITLDLSLPSTITALEPTRPSGVTVATRRDDLEYGQSASPDLKDVLWEAVGQQEVSLQSHVYDRGMGV